MRVRFILVVVAVEKISEAMMMIMNNSAAEWLNVNY